MDIFSLLLIGLGLSMDAVAVSISNSMCFTNINRKNVILTSFLFGFFQALMPIIGFFAGQVFSGAIEAVDHWIALVLLAFIGGKMIVDAIHEINHPEDDKSICGRPIDLKIVFMQAIATSIDALAVGITLAIMRVNILYAAFIIGIITFVCCIIGAFIGKKFGYLLKEKAEIFGGIILIGIGIKIFVEHMFFKF